MTSRLVFEGMLTELSKTGAPSLLLLDFNYFFNKAINLYINKRYNIYDINLQTTDDLRVLKSTAILEPSLVDLYGSLISSEDLNKYSAGKAKIFGATYEVIMPLDYLHLLNCICIYKVNKNFKCYNKEDYVLFSAKRLTADTWSTIINDYYNRPLPWRPYYYIHNINTLDLVPTNPLNADNLNGTDLFDKYNVGPTGNDGVNNPNSSNFPRTITLNDTNNRVVSTVERDACTRYGNSSNVRMEIRYGSDNTIFTLEKVFVDYVKTPQVIRLTLELMNLTEDTSQIMEFPDYVCQEIINELTTLVMENTSNPRLQTNPIVTQSIANPAQQLAPQSRPQQSLNRG